MKIVVLGWGQFGQAIGSLLTYNRVAFTSADIDSPLKHSADLLFQMVPTQFIRPAFQTNQQFIKPGTTIVNGAKGIEEDTHQLPHQIIQDLGPYSHYYSLIGPSFASGIVAQDPTLVSLGYTSDEHVELIKDVLQTPYFRIQETKGIGLLELSSALKNVYAILCGYAEGRGFGMNTRAKLIALALQELAELGKAMDMTDIEVTAPGIVGDLVLTCSSAESRNFQFGLLLATKGQAATTFNQAKTTVEGRHTSKSAQALAHQYQVDLPLSDLTHRIIEDGKDGAQHFQAFVESL